MRVVGLSQLCSRCLDSVGVGCRNISTLMQGNSRKVRRTNLNALQELEELLLVHLDLMHELEYSRASGRCEYVLASVHNAT